MSVFPRIAMLLDAERDRWVLWAPVFFGAGIATYFSLNVEPEGWVGPLCAAAAVCIAFFYRHIQAVTITMLACALFWVGFSGVKFRSDWIDAPVLKEPVGPGILSGRILRIEAFPDRPRLLLDQLTWSGRDSPSRLPERVLVRLYHDVDQPIGTRIQGRVRLMPLPGPVSPGAYDFRRKSWFERIGATGYSVGRFTRIEQETEDPISLSIGIDQFRYQLATHLERVLPAPENALVIALITGDRSRIPPATTEAMRDSGLAHLLAISGLHIGLVATLVFVIVRFILAAIEPLALRTDIKKWAATAALLASFIYLLISGSTLPTQRAFVMGAMALCAVLLGREAISLRLVAMAAMVVLILRPESLLSASFQMSFTAVTALVAFYEMASPSIRRLMRPPVRLRHRILLYFLTLVATTVVAGISTGLIAYFHFGRITHYGLVANLIAVPVTALWIMPMGVLGTILIPFGLEFWPLHFMATGVSVVTTVAGEVASWPGAVTLHPKLPMPAFLVCLVGGLWLCLMHGRWRWSGIALVLGGLIAIPLTPRPDILINDTGKLFAVRLPDGRLGLSQTSRNKFAAGKWLQQDGQQNVVHWSENFGVKPSVRCDGLGCMYENDRHRIAFVRHPSALSEDCRTTELVVVYSWRRKICPNADIPTISLRDLKENGAYAIYLQHDGPKLVAANDLRGARPWSTRPAPSR